MIKYEGIIIDTQHKEQIDKAIADAEENMKSRIIAPSYGDGFKVVLEAIQKLEKKYHDAPKGTLDDCAWRYDPFHQDFPATYKYPPKSTQIELYYKAGKWRLLGIKREICMPGSYEFVSLSLSNNFKKWVLGQHQRF